MPSETELFQQFVDFVAPYQNYVLAAILIGIFCSAVSWLFSSLRSRGGN